MVGMEKTSLIKLAGIGPICVMAALLVGCAPQTVISSKHQVMVEASTHEEAIDIATKACADYDREILLSAQYRGGYWFKCLESEAERKVRLAPVRVRIIKQPTQLKQLKKDNAPKAEAKPLPKPLPPEKIEQKAAKPAPVKAPPTTVAKAVAKPDPVVARTSTASNSGSWVTFGSFRTEIRAENFVRAFNNNHPKLAREHSVMVNEIKLGPRGIFYRSQLGPFVDDSTAKSLCVDLKNKGSKCFVVSRR
jgi:cell division septation protein DedD